jgi:hypothetical protein
VAKSRRRHRRKKKAWRDVSQRNDIAKKIKLNNPAGGENIHGGGEKAAVVKSSVSISI